MRRDRLVTSLVLAGVFPLAVLPVAVVVRAVVDAGPLTPTEALADGAIGVVVPLLVAGLAVLARRREDRALLGLALVGAVVSVPATVGLGLLPALLWLPALVRLEGGGRVTVRGALGMLLVAALGLAALVAPTMHRDPACWTFTETPEGTRTYVEAPVEGRYPAGFSAPGLGFGAMTASGTESAGEVVEIDAETGEPVEPVDEPRRIEGETCVSDRTTIPQALLSTALGLAALAVAAGRPATSR